MNKESLIKYIIGCIKEYLTPGFPIFRSKHDINQAIKMLEMLLIESQNTKKNSKNDGDAMTS